MTPADRTPSASPGGGAKRTGMRDERGSSMVEFALGASLLFMVVFGIIAMALALYTYNVVSEAAREATRYAIVRGSACPLWHGVPGHGCRHPDLRAEPRLSRDQFQ